MKEGTAQLFDRMDSTMHTIDEVIHTKEGNHSQTSVLNLCSLQAEGLGVVSTGQTQRVKGTAYIHSIAQSQHASLTIRNVPHLGCPLQVHTI